jgi:hypothetical protein
MTILDDIPNYYKANNENYTGSIFLHNINSVRITNCTFERGLRIFNCNDVDIRESYIRRLFIHECEVSRVFDCELGYLDFSNDNGYIAMIGNILNEEKIDDVVVSIGKIHVFRDEIAFRFRGMRREKYSEYNYGECQYCGRALNPAYVYIIVNLKEAGLLDKKYPPLCCYCFQDF